MTELFSRGCGGKCEQTLERFEMTAAALEGLEAELSILRQQTPTAVGDQLEQLRAWADMCETLINGATVGEIVEIEVPRGTMRYEVVLVGG